VAGNLFRDAEKRSIVAPGLFGEDLDPRARGQRSGGFVESDVPIAAQTEELQVDTSGGGDAPLVEPALGLQVCRDSVGEKRSERDRNRQGRKAIRP